MIIYILSLASILAGIIALITYLKYNNLKIIYDINSEKLLKLELDFQKLINEKIELLKSTEHLKANLSNSEESAAKIHQNSKSILYDISKNMVDQLIDIHKKEVNEARKQTEENISKSTENFNLELQKVSNLISSLNKDFESSKSLVDNLQKSLLSPVSTGALAEITLENLLKNSGLRANADFFLQYSFEGEENNKLRPDVVILLPNENILIIDAKSSQFLVSQSDLSELAKSMNNHLKSLISKDYTGQLQEDLRKKNISVRRVSTAMFVPTDQALIKISEADKNFINNAWKNNIYPVGPAGLMNILSVARMHISEKMRIDNYENIILEINNMLNSITLISNHAFRLGASVSSIVSNYDKFAASFNRNIISKVKKLKIFGASTSIKQTKMLERYQLVSSKNELIELEANDTEIDSDSTDDNTRQKKD
ncbi:MAG: DNA recombination protein RmuC [Rickettsiaceae bacterium]|nr:DNA recombination protein RmuC [Rickettsiaceae bacterium]